jgi:hypothetical protein
MNLNEFYNEVARRADTGKIAVTAADTKRVLAVAFRLLASKDAATSSAIVAEGLALGAKKKGK